MFVTKNEVVTAPCLTDVEELISISRYCETFGEGVSSPLMPVLIVLKL